jgi:hypothetical protein
MISSTLRRRSVRGVVCGALLACHRPAPAPAPAPNAPPPAPVVTDTLDPGELLEGTERAFTLKLPRGVHVEESFAKVVFAQGSLKAADVANYVRSRVRGGSVHVGAAATIFDNVFATDEPTRPLFIHVEPLPRGGGTRIEVRDATPPPPTLQGATEAERWKAAGLTPEGRIADPTHLR